MFPNRYALLRFRQVMQVTIRTQSLRISKRVKNPRVSVHNMSRSVSSRKDRSASAREIIARLPQRDQETTTQFHFSKSTENFIDSMTAHNQFVSMCLWKNKSCCSHPYCSFIEKTFCFAKEYPLLKKGSFRV